jgi:hypothetical protein
MLVRPQTSFLEFIYVASVVRLVSRKLNIEGNLIHCCIVFSQFWLAETDVLDRIVLFNVCRNNFEAINISGNFLCICMRKMQALSVHDLG